MPTTIKNSDLANVVSKFLSLTETAVTELDIDKCHRMKKEKTVILELKTRTLRDLLIKGRTSLKDKKTDITSLGLGNSFISESLCPEYKKLDFVCRKLKKNMLIAETWFFNGRLFVIDNAGEKMLITHMNDIFKIADESVVDAYFIRS